MTREEFQTISTYWTRIRKDVERAIHEAAAVRASVPEQKKRNRVARDILESLPTFRDLDQFEALLFEGLKSTVPKNESRAKATPRAGGNE